MKIFFLEIVRAIAELHSFSETAAVLNCSQSNISYAVSEVEKYFGKKIFLRNRRGCQPTTEGATIVKKISNIIDIIETIKKMRLWAV
ncbi:LysR family transcriptional regulator [Erwinia tasmaniensis]|uniref:LysR family transcriptional regulator n=1 Tax=Erwinia tasmaniensis TaxID=338565 RepID=UPI003A4DAD64